MSNIKRSFKDSKMKDLEVLSKCHHVYDSYLVSGHSLVDPIQNIVQSIDHEKGEWFEYTQTLAPKKFSKVKIGTHKNGKPKYRKDYYGEMSPQKQYKLLKTNILKYVKENDFILVMSYEWQKNGNLHTHAILRHKGNYELPIKTMQQYFKKLLGKNSMSIIRNGSTWAGYIVKDLAKSGIPMECVNTKWISLNDKPDNIMFWFNAMNIEQS